MALLTPKIELIKAKYRGRTDQVTMRKQQEEIMQLQQQEGYNPLSGCLPMLLQLPVIIWLYKVIRMPLTYIMGMADADAIGLWNRFNPSNLYQNQDFNQID
jgi:YidC/Oxa1 family membrane protein insertase